MNAAIQNIAIDVETQYLAEQSLPGHRKYAFAYTITITNQGAESVRLLNRHWLITDGNNEMREVWGEGVVGEQPVIDAGDSYSYTSGAVLATAAGTMEGSYEMISASGRLFLAPVNTFSLAGPGALH